jgi:acetylornithine deacetylase/succinyl-diaminopimelate desuccinylase-like protein
MSEKFLEYFNQNKDRFLDELIEVLSIPSVSNGEANKSDVVRCAEWLKAHMEKIGLQNTEIYKTKGHPIVYGDYMNAGKDKPVILIYGHYDVQPPEPLDRWVNPPFSPIVKDGKIYGRGTADDKGQIFIHLKAIESFLKTDGTLPINVKIIFEGEEEIGSENLGEFISSHKELLKAEYVVISDTEMYEKGKPAICYGLRGLCYMQIDVTGPNRDLHSGTYGGAVENPINALAKIISQLKSDEGKILIDGFYDDVTDLTEEERKELNKLATDENQFKKDLDVKSLTGEKGYTLVERLTARPTLDCNGIWGGFQGKGTKTVIPSEAGVKISMRLVPQQNPEKIAELFKKYIEKISPDTIKVKVSYLHGGKPSVTSINSPAIKAAMSALKKGFETEPVFIKDGGSIPIVSTFKDELGADAILMGFGLPDDNIHSPNEKFELENFYKGIISVCYYYNELSNLEKFN